MRRPSFFVLPVALAVAAVPLVAAPASAGGWYAQPRCGDTLTRDTVLKRDLVCTTGPGLTLGVDVDLDLRGHTLEGPGSGTGILVTLEGSNTVRGGAMTGWGSGVAFLQENVWPEDDDDPGPDSNTYGTLTVDRMRFRDNGYAVDTGGVSGLGGFTKPTTVRRSTFTDNYAGVVTAWFSTATVDRSTFVRNRIAAWSNADLTVTRSTFLRNETAATAYEASVDVSGSVLVGNTTGVSAAGVGFAGVTRSTVVGGDVAIHAGSAGTVTVRDSLVKRAGTGLLVDGGSATVDRTVFRGNDVGLRQSDASWGTTVVRDSRFARNGDGLVSEWEYEDGIRIGGTTAVKNSGWGIHAPEAVDLGGNRAWGNGRSPQCVGVVCGR